MPRHFNLTRTEISAIFSILLFSITILLNAVGPAKAEAAAPAATAKPAAVSTLPYRA
ncbi:MAG: hypothetical protein U5J78_00910 [Parasphingorhabdus sp.]|nr:hypothetical protein [Parasphingorhabdus sp.]